jgi:N-acetylmuramoyl-L-alanine amidase
MKLIWLAITLFITGCSSLPPSRFIDHGDYLIDPSHAAVAQNERVRFLVLHYTALDDQKSLSTLTGPDVSAHYLVPTIPASEQNKPVVLQLVQEHKRAWHAGMSNWGQRSNLNDTAIGIEIVNPGYTDESDGRHWYPYRQEQIALIGTLTRDLLERYQIAPENILAHSDIALQRKSDPGPLFPWKALAEQGIGAWPDPETVEKYLAQRPATAPVTVTTLLQALKQYGYATPPSSIQDDATTAVIRAFQMHFRPADFSGKADAETEAIALALVEKYNK